MVSNAAWDARLQREMVDAPAPEQRGLTRRLTVPSTLEDVELGVRPDVDDGEPEARLLGHVVGYRRIEDVAVEGVQAVGVARDDRHMVHAVQQHAQQRTASMPEQGARGVVMWIRVAIGVVLLVVGGVWIGQGVGWIEVRS